MQHPFEKVLEQSCAVYDTACLDIFVQTGIIDLLSDVRPVFEGMSVAEIHNRLDLNADKLTVVLRYMACQGWLTEVKEGTFALTRAALELQVGRNGRIWAM
jgi:DNA-binding IclR family transcriptional regulator